MLYIPCYSNQGIFCLWLLPICLQIVMLFNAPGDVCGEINLHFALAYLNIILQCASKISNWSLQGYYMMHQNVVILLCFFLTLS